MKRYIFSLIAFAALFQGCGNHSLSDILDCDDVNCVLDGAEGIMQRTGWLASSENFNNIPQDIAVSNVSASGLPSSVSIESKFPPIGDQGQYGTCVAWASGYGLKTSLNAIERGWTSSDLSKTANQTSPKDLWFSIANSKKGANCNGTNFEYALDALIANGAASMSNVPYSNLGTCSGSSVGNASNKLANYRKIAYNNALQGGSGKDGMTLENFKGYLSQGRPILIGAKLGDRFMRWSNSSVISSDTYNQPNMQHAYHAMVLVGYDDSRDAFRVRNSWGKSWGDNGSIWVDYDFFLNNFCTGAFVGQNQTSAVKDEVKDGDLLAGYDLLAASAEDFADPNGNSARARAFSYEIFNSGKNTVAASQKWTVVYMYYNAANANDFQIIFADYYTNEYGSLGDYGNYNFPSALDGGTWNNMNVLPGKKAGEDVFGSDGFYITYTMPNITGKYYLVAFADAYDKIKESNEDNNFYFITAENGKPLEFANGILQSKLAASAKILAKSAKLPMSAPAASIQELGGDLNAYTPTEIKALISQNKKSGVLAKKIADYNTAKTKKVKR